MILSLPDGIPTAQIEAILNRDALKGAVVSVAIASTDGQALFSRNTDLLLMPASNQKILSVAYALWKLGPEHAPVTRIWKTRNGLLVDAPGDPSMTYEKLAAARRTLGSAPHKKVLVRQAYRPGYGPGWEWDDLPNRSAPTVTAFCFNTNSFEVWGSPTRLWIKPNPFGIRIEHQPKRAGPNVFDLATKRLVVTGPLPKSEAKIEAFALPRPDALAAQILGGNLARTSEVPDEAADFEIKGDSVGTMAKACLQPSDNFIAESLLLMAARAEGPFPPNSSPTGEFTEAAKRMKGFLTRIVGLSPSEVDPYDGSGLSRHNNVSASGIVKVLQWAKRQPWGAVWRDALASPGTGTLKNRLQNSGFRGKTGTLNKACTLSGYCTTKDGRELVVSILLNHYLCGDAAARGVQDEIVRLIEASDSNGPKLAYPFLYAADTPHPSYRTLDAHRIRRPRVDGLAP